MTQNSALLLTKPTHPAPVTAGRPLIGNMLDLRPKAVPLILQEIAPGSHA